MFGTFGKTTLLAAAALAVMTAGASAAPWDHRGDHRGPGFDHRRPVIEHRHYVERTRIVENLRLRHYRVFGEPYFVRGHYVVRTHDRFGRLVFVQIDPYSGAFLGEIRL
jgi:hypothetical protein